MLNCETSSNLKHEIDQRKQFKLPVVYPNQQTEAQNNLFLQDPTSCRHLQSASLLWCLSKNTIMKAGYNAMNKVYLANHP